MRVEDFGEFKFIVSVYKGLRPIAFTKHTDSAILASGHL